MKLSMISSPVLIGLVFVSGYFQHSHGKFSMCGLFDLLYPVLGGANHNLKYMLFTHTNPKDACDLQPTKEALRKCNFNPKAKTEVLIHGWIPMLDKDNVFVKYKDKLLEKDNYNVVIFNWTYYSNTYNSTSNDDINYDLAAVNSFFVGLQLSSWIRFLQVDGGADPKSFHIITHSLGSEVASYAGKSICKLGHLTFLDAAAPRFRYLPEFLRPTYTDAYFVEEIHTSGSYNEDTGYGFVRPIADIGYYPNGGEMQPNCFYGAKYISVNEKSFTVNSQSTQTSCNHASSFEFYLASFDESCKFLGLICNSYEDFNSGKCSRENSPVCRMGFYSKRLPGLPVHSRCYLNTSASSPYCIN